MNEAPPLPPVPKGFKATPKPNQNRGVWLKKRWAVFNPVKPVHGWSLVEQDCLFHSDVPSLIAVPISEDYEAFWDVEKLPKDTPPEDPKGEAGKTKAQLQLIPPVFNAQVAKALACGAAKYGPWNWREHKVEMMTYLGAMKRHIDQVIEREDIDPESQAHHLGHVAAGCAIVLDAMRHGTLIDNRPSVTRD